MKLEIVISHSLIQFSKFIIFKLKVSEKNQPVKKVSPYHHPTTNWTSMTLTSSAKNTEKIIKKLYSSLTRENGMDDNFKKMNSSNS